MHHGYQVLEMPPNTQGATALEMLNLRRLRPRRWAITRPPTCTCRRSQRIACGSHAWLADPGSVPADVLKKLLSAGTRRSGAADQHGARARDYKAMTLQGSAPVGGEPPQARGDTIYLTAADRDGNVVSLIQSIFESFGSGIVAGDTGIVLHNRGTSFSLRPGHPNVLAPGKRPFHTLVPAMVLKDGRPWLSFGVMGGDMQPQGHTQVLLNLIDFGMNVQEAGEAPRFRHSANGLALESAISPEARFGLDLRGHRITTGVGVFGGFQGILIDPKTGVMMGGSDPRKDGLAIGH